MKKISKVLCLVLVLAMMAGLCCFGTSAAYADADKITYKEAVDVLSAIGVLQGDDNGFRPADGLTRAEACKILAYLTGASDVTTACSFKDCQGHWAANYIGYCAAQGYVNGVGNNKFDPEGKLTGYAFAKMLLCALGYDAEIEGMTGSAWEVGVAKLVKATGLSLGLAKFVGAANITREEAAQLGLNALQAAEVGYAAQQGVSSNGVTTITTSLKASTIFDRENAGDVHQLMESYFPTLMKVPGVDAMGESTWVWKLGTTTIGNYADNKPIITYTASTPAPVVAAALNGYTINADKYINGVDTAENIAGVGAAATIAGLTGNGVEVQIYADLTGTIYKVVVTYTKLATIIAKDTANKTVTIRVTEGITNYDSKLTAMEADPSEAAAYKALYELNTKDVVLVTVNQTAATASNVISGNDFFVRAVYGKADVVTGTCSKKVVSPLGYQLDTYTVAGTEYKVNAALVTGEAPAASTGPAVDAAVVNDVYLDQYGYIIGHKAADVTTNYAYILGVDKVGSLGAYDYYAGLVFADGKTDWVKIAAIVAGDTTYKLPNAIAAHYTDLVNSESSGFVAYVAGADGYMLSAVTVGGGVEIGSPSATTMTKGSALFDGKAMTNKTALLVAQKDGTFTATKGLSNMPNMQVTGSYLLVDGALVMIVADVTAATNQDVIFFAKNVAGATSQICGITPVYTYTALVDGVLKTDVQISNASRNAGLYQTGTTVNDEYGYYTLSTAMTPDGTISGKTTLTSTLPKTVKSIVFDAAVTVKNNGTSLVVAKDTDNSVSAVLADDFMAYTVDDAGNLAFVEIGNTDETDLAYGSDDYCWIVMNADNTAAYAIFVDAPST